MTAGEKRKDRKRGLYTIDEIKSRALGALDSLVPSLAPRGSRKGDEWVALNPARNETVARNFSVNMKTGIWSDFATGDRGDVIDLVAYLKCAGIRNKGAAIVWLKDGLGLTGKEPDPGHAAQAAASRKKHDADAARKKENRRAFAMTIWSDAAPLTGEDPASLYLAARGIDVTALAEGPPRALRFHPRVAATDGMQYPALIACVSLEGVKHGFAGIHRIYLAERGGRWVKARAKGDGDKEALGSIKGGCVRLQRGASRQALADMPAGEWPAWTEGIEDGLVIALVEPHRRVLAGPILANLGAIVLPPQCGGLLVVRDNDAPGSAADNQLMKCCHKLRAQGVRVKIAHMPAGFKDPNDVLLNKRAG
jgi:hypothetical protein